MLHADKGAFLSSVQRDAVQLHKQELEYFMLRYVALATVSSILVGFCWMGLIKSGELFRAACSSVADELTHVGCDGNTTAHHRDPNLVAAFYVADSLALVVSLYNFSLCAFITIYGYGYALRGPAGSLARSVAVFLKHRTETLVTFVASIVLLMIAAAILTWLKVTWWGLIAAAVFALALLLGAAKVNALYRTLRIGKEVVGGEMKLVHANSDGGIALEETSARHVQHLTNNHRLEEEEDARYIEGVLPCRELTEAQARAALGGAGEVPPGVGDAALLPSAVLPALAVVTDALTATPFRKRFVVVSDGVLAIYDSAGGYHRGVRPRSTLELARHALATLGVGADSVREEEDGGGAAASDAALLLELQPADGGTAGAALQLRFDEAAERRRWARTISRWIVEGARPWWRTGEP
jgi:hypothetical protein